MKKFLGVFVLISMFCNLVLAQSSLSECKGNDIKNPIKKFIIIRKWTNCHGIFLGLKGEMYIGEFYKGKFHGKGTFTAAGRKYVGEYKKHLMHGQGIYTWANGAKYVGEWKDAKFHRLGTYTFSDGRVLKGIWKKSELIEQH